MTGARSPGGSACDTGAHSSAIATQQQRFGAYPIMSGSLEIPVSAEAREAFAAAVERDPVQPARALASADLAPTVRREVESLLTAYDRGRAIERALCDPLCGIDRVVASVARAHAAPVDRAIPSRIGAYSIERVLSRTAQAAVLLAQQERPIQREVALKLLFEDASDPDIAGRVELERQILAALEHPNIARIYDFGVDERNRPYIVMERVRDGTIAEWCMGRAQSSEEGAAGRLGDSLRVFLQVTEAVRYAHARGVLHCDLKPANILIQELEGAPYAKVIDFGIARAFGGALAERSALLDLSQSVGTLLSMSPEALKPGGSELDVRTDVFGLGLVLFELIAGRPPRIARDGDLVGTVRDLLEQPIPRLSQVASGIPADLDAILAKACATDSAQRYESVAAFAADLEAFLAGREVSARRRGGIERVRRVVGRRWRVGAIALGVAGVSLAWVQFVEGPVRARVTEQFARAQSSIAAASALRNIAGSGEQREAHAAEALEAARLAIELGGRTPEAVELRAAALEEAILPRLVRDDHTSSETVRLVNELVQIREDAVKVVGDARSLERLSIALAYQLDTVRYTDAYPALEARQLALDEELHARDPESRLYADNLSWSYQRVMGPMWTRGESRRALELMRRSSEIAEANLAKHGASAVTRHTAAAAALYDALAASVDGRPLADLRDAAKRAREHAAALLKWSPDHAKGADFALSATIVEARALIDHGMEEDGAKLLADVRSWTAPVILRELAVGQVGFRIAASWELEARAWIACGEASRAHAAVDAFVREIEREGERRRQRKMFERAIATRDMLYQRVALLRGEVAEVRAALPAILARARRALDAEGAGALDEIALDLLEHVKEVGRNREQVSPEVLAMFKDIAQAVDADLKPTEVGEDGRPLPRHSRFAVELILDRGADLAAIARAIRAREDHGVSLEAPLQRLERWAGSRDRP
jgi:serine/threonine protein kinase